MAAFVHPPFCQLSQVTIIGAGNVGSTLAQRVLERNLADVILLDIVEGRPQGIALDLMEARGAEGHNRTIVGSNCYEDTAQSDIVVVTAGLPRKPGMSRDDLLQVNGKIVIDIMQQAMKYSPYACYIIVTNPLDAMTYLALKVSGLPANHIMGMAGVLDSARFQTFIAMELGVPPSDVSALVLGGHGDLMVPLPQYSTVGGIPVTELLEAAILNRLIERTRNGGAEIVQLLKRGGAYYAPASAIGVMIEAILYNQSRILPVAAYLDGEYQLQDVYLGVPCRLGGQGVEEIVSLPLRDEQLTALHRSAAAVKQSIEKAIALIP
ncbi:Malate dehydrogenase [Halomicronema hongdechloris C2206]|uniref:Malate dehydrogenase n=1 Tax=Halomicronema hongdechloris C2206 TaxID=1641165 RepID=A0A1Z3HIM6_9CYAN|nr:malate dehydrogenase [Halomicronema hongdechloris]ASC69957.1 Malate dehydrogenase [Halomicronema hongdechloris C2206]